MNDISTLIFIVVTIIIVWLLLKAFWWYVDEKIISPRFKSNWVTEGLPKAERLRVITQNINNNIEYAKRRAAASIILMVISVIPILLLALSYKSHIFFIFLSPFAFGKFFFELLYSRQLLSVFKNDLKKATGNNKPPSNNDSASVNYDKKPSSRSSIYEFAWMIFVGCLGSLLATFIWQLFSP